jgi:hypothetical protein
MLKLAHLALSLAALALHAVPSLRAQGETPEASPPKRFVIPPDINGHKTIVAAPAAPRSLRVAMYEGPGAPGVNNVEAGARQLPGVQITRLSAEDVGTVDLSSRFDVIVFSGGSGSKQGNAIGETGRAKVREFVRNGGGYLGVCAGAYLACTNFDWGLAILDARTASPKWRRGQAFLDLKIEPAGEPVFGAVTEPFKCRYNNGPILVPAGRDDIPDYTTAATFLTESALNDTPVGIQIGSPAMALGTFGKGRVFVSSPHPENTPGLEQMIPRALLWAAGDPAR